MTAMLVVFVLGPWLINSLRLRQGKGQPIREDGPKSHLLTKKGTPTMGGLMILLGLCVATVLWANPFSPYVWIVLAVTLSFGLIGFYDDYLKVTKRTASGFSGRFRLFLELLVAGLATYAIASAAGCEAVRNVVNRAVFQGRRDQSRAGAFRLPRDFCHRGRRQRGEFDRRP